MLKRLFILSAFITLVLTMQGQEVVAISDTIVPKSFQKEHNPTKALLLSIIPGGGQIYNGQAWKAPIFYAALGGTGYFVYDNYKNMKMFKTEYLYRISHGGERVLEEYTGYPDNSIYNMYQTYNKNFQLFILVTAAVYGLNMLDAYVFGHLYDFQINDDLTLNVEPSLIPMYTTTMSFAPSLQLSLKF